MVSVPVIYGCGTIPKLSGLNQQSIFIHTVHVDLVDLACLALRQLKSDNWLGLESSEDSTELVMLMVSLLMCQTSPVKTTETTRDKAGISFPKALVNPVGYLGLLHNMTVSWTTDFCKLT